MSIPTVTDFAQSLCRYRLLEANQQDELLGDLQGRFAEPRELAAELVRRGWLTSYQFHQLSQGRGHELLLGSYILLDHLGEGGMGTVFKARNWKLGQTVALKLIRKERLESEQALKRFRREIQLVSKLNHPNIVRAFDADEVNGIHFLVMEYVAGIDLARLVKTQGVLPVATACEYIRQAALGLQHAFEQGLVHRDIKPHNLLLSQKSETRNPKSEGTTAIASDFGFRVSDLGIVKVLDMGLARFNSGGEGGESTSTMTQDGVVMGTPDYIAPEQGLDSHEVDIRADLYSLGCTLYYLLAGRVPFPNGTMMQKLMSHQLHEPTPVENLRPEVPPPVAAIVRKLMAKNPEDRYQTPAELARALATVTASPTGSVEEMTLAPQTSVPAQFAAKGSDLPGASLTPLIVVSRAKGSARGKRWGLPVLAGGVVAGLIVLAVLLRGWPFADRPTVPDFPVVKAPAEKPGTSLPKKIEPEPQPAADPLKFPPGPVSDAWIKAVRALPAGSQAKAVFAKLGELNPGIFEGGQSFKTSEDVVTELYFAGNNLTDLSPLRALAGLKKINSSGKGGSFAPNPSSVADLSLLKDLKLNQLTLPYHRVSDLTPLKGMPLEILNLDHSNVNDLSLLKDLPLRELSLKFCPVSDLSPLQGMKLTSLDLEGTLVKDLTPLKGLPLQILRVPATNVRELAPLENMPLKALDLTDTPVTDLTPLQDLPLTKLEFFGAPVQSIEPLRKLPLESVGCNFNALRDGTVLPGLPTLKTINGEEAKQFWGIVFPTPKLKSWVKATSALAPAERSQKVMEKLVHLNPGYQGKGQLTEEGTSLTLDGEKLVDLSPLSALTHLKSLKITNVDMGLRNLWPLRDLPLEELYLPESRILDLAPLEGMALKKLSLTRSMDLRSIAPLQSMKLSNLDIGGTPVADLAPLKGMPLKHVSCGAWGPANLEVLTDAPLEVLYLTYNHSRHAKTLRSFNVLKQINGKNPAQFWYEVAVHQVDFVRGELKRLNPGFDGKVDHDSKDGVVWRLGLATDQVADITPIHTLTGLKGLHLGSGAPNGLLKNLQPLKGMKLESLNIVNTQVNDLSPLAGMPIRSFSLSNSAVTDLSLLQTMPLELVQCPGIHTDNFQPLKEIPLGELTFDFNLWRDESVLRPHKTLKKINLKPVEQFWKEVDTEKATFEKWCREVAKLPAKEQVDAVAEKFKEFNPGTTVTLVPELKDNVVKRLEVRSDTVVDLSAVRALTELEELNCTPKMPKPKLANLWPLRGMKLVKLHARGNPIRDLTPLQGMKLTHLDITGTLVKDLSPLQDLPLLYLAFQGTAISDLEPLRGMKLQHLDASVSLIKDLSPLQGMPLHYLAIALQMDQDLSHLKGMPLTTLTIGCTSLPDLSPLNGMKLQSLTVYCNNNPTADLSPLENLPLQSLTMPIVPWRDSKSLRAIKTLKTVNGKPAAEFHAWADWEDAVHGLPADKQVYEVTKKLKELNPEFKPNTNVEKTEGKVTGFQLITDHITDISPMRAFPDLTKLTLSPIKPGVSRFTDLSPLRRLKLNTLVLSALPVTDLSPLVDTKIENLVFSIVLERDAKILQAMPTLKTINGKPKEEVLKIAGK